MKYALELQQMAMVVQYGRSRETDAGAVEESGGDLLRLTTGRIRVVTLEEVGVYPLERRVVTRQRRLLERAALGFVVAQEMAPVQIAHLLLQRAVKLQRFADCAITDSAVGSTLLLNGFLLTFRHGLLVRHWYRRLRSCLH